MKKIEAETLEYAYAQAAAEFKCSVTALQVEIIQAPSNGFFGFFKKSAIIVATPAGSPSLTTSDSHLQEQEETPSFRLIESDEPEELVLGDEYYEQADDYEEASEDDYYQLSA